MSEMNVENVITQMRRGVLELCILSALQRGDAYTTDLVNALKEAEMIVVEPASLAPQEPGIPGLSLGGIPAGASAQVLQPYAAGHSLLRYTAKGLVRHGRDGEHAACQ